MRSSSSISTFSTSSSSHDDPPLPQQHQQHQSVIATKLQKQKNAPTVWVEFAALAASLSTEVINLGQGFPNWVGR